jgi:hypothetical protein
MGELEPSQTPHAPEEEEQLPQARSRLWKLSPRQFRWVALLAAAGLAGSLTLMRELGIGPWETLLVSGGEECPFDMMPATDPHLPAFDLGFRLRPRESGGAMLQLKNVTVYVKDTYILCRNPERQLSKKFNVKAWDYLETIEVGENNSWDFTQGNEIIVQAPGYQPRILSLQ